MIKVIAGIRRCGKSTLFKLYQEYLIETGVESRQIISINLENLDFEELLDYKKLYNYINQILKKNKDRYTYIFIDEIQNCPSFEKAIDSLFIKENTDIYITGSNAYMLSGDLATLLSGRYVKIDMLPLSFSEYISAKNNSVKSLIELFNDYISYGSFPYTATIPNNEQVINNYLDSIYNTILIKDIAKRQGITDILLLESIIKTIASGIGSPVSIKKISDSINSRGRKVSVNSVDNYVKALCDAYIFYKVDRFDIKGKQYLKTLGKYYIADIGIRRILLSTASSDIGHIIENIFYLELIRRNYKINIGKLGEKEVDFVAQNHNGLEYYQISASVLDENTLQRELYPLQSINDNYPKYLITLDEVPKGANFNGIRHINLIDFLLNKNI